jgi:hypothetical protein
MRKSIVFYVFATMMITAIASADVYKCVSDDGVVTFSDQPCGEEAALVFQDTNLSVDEAIGNASPYTQPVPYSGDIDKDVLLHARKIGRSILPNENLESYDISKENMGIYYTWKVFLSYVTPHKEHLWSRIELDYRGEPKGKGVFVQLKFISIKRADWFTPLPTLKNVKKLKKHAHYGWHVIPQPQ